MWKYATLSSLFKCVFILSLVHNRCYENVISCNQYVSCYCRKKKEKKFCIKFFQLFINAYLSTNLTEICDVMRFIPNYFLKIPRILNKKKIASRAINHFEFFYIFCKNCLTKRLKIRKIWNLTSSFEITTSHWIYEYVCPKLLKRGPTQRLRCAWIVHIAFFCIFHNFWVLTSKR